MPVAVKSPQVVLFFPKTGWDYKGVSVHLPLAVLFVAAPLVARGYRVQIIDQRVDPDWQQTLTLALRQGEVRAVGISSMTGAQILGGLSASELVKRVAPDVPVVWGGVHASLMPQQTISDERVDAIVNGDGEDPFLEIVQAIEAGRSLSAIAGVYSKEGGRVVGGGGARAYPDIEDLPRLPYDLIDVPSYVTSNTMGKRDLIAQTSRGCPHECTFCYDVAFAERTWRAWSPTRVVAELTELVQRYGLNAVHFQEDNFFVSKKRAGDIAELILKAGLDVEIRTNCRADYIATWEPSYLELLRRAGFVELFIGVEAGTDHVLRELIKGTTVDEVRLVNLKLRDADIAPKFSFMAGFPFESLTDVKSTLRLMVELSERNPKTRTSQLQLFCAYPGTPLYDEFVKRGVSFPQSLEGWGDVNFNRIDYPWLSPSDRKFLEAASLFSFFLDGTTIPDYFSKNPLIKYPAMLYGQVVRARTRAGFYQAMPEIAVAKWLKGRDFNVRAGRREPRWRKDRVAAIGATA